MISIYELAEITKRSEVGLYMYMLKQNKDVDYQNIPENGFKTKIEFDEWWKGKDVITTMKIYDEYYGIDNLIESYK